MYLVTPRAHTHTHATHTHVIHTPTTLPLIIALSALVSLLLLPCNGGGGGGGGVSRIPNIRAEHTEAVSLLNGVFLGELNTVYT